jgi:hypothetical protein
MEIEGVRQARDIFWPLVSGDEFLGLTRFSKKETILDIHIGMCIAP